MKETWRLLILLILLLSAFVSCSSTTITSEEINSADTFKVLTYNIHHANPPSADDYVINVEAIAKVINAQHPDFVALQEVDVNTKRSGIKLNEAAAIAKLTGMHYHFTRAIFYQGGVYGDAVLSRFPIIKSMNYHLPVWGENEELRAVCMVKVKLPGGSSILFASTHLGLTKDTRLLQVNKILNIINELNDPLIIAGDFNTKPGSPIVNKLGNVLTKSCSQNCPYTFPANDPNKKIDFIMFRPADFFQAIKQQVISGYGSDHAALVVNLYTK